MNNLYQYNQLFQSLQEIVTQYNNNNINCNNNIKENNQENEIQFQFYSNQCDSLNQLLEKEEEITTFFNQCKEQ